MIGNIKSRYENLAGCGIIQKSAYGLYRLLYRFLLKKEVVDTNGLRLTPQRPFLPSAHGKESGRCIICITGFGHSGSGAIVDLLSEYDGVDVIGFTDKESGRARCMLEFDLMRRMGGLFCLENCFVDRFNQDSYIKLFLRFVSYLHTEIGGAFNEDFMAATRDFLDELVLMKIGPLDSYGYAGNPHLSVLGNAGAQILYGAAGIKRRFRLKPLPISEYRRVAQRYVGKVLGIISSAQYLVLDQATSDGTADMEKYIGYLGPHKLIVVYRDPRDVYATARIHSVKWIPNDPRDFVQWYLNSVSGYLKVSHKDFLLLRFEDCCRKYEETKKRIEAFVGLAEGMHCRKFTAFNPAVSIKNVGLHRELKDCHQNMAYIENQLAAYLYQDV